MNKALCTAADKRRQFRDLLAKPECIYAADVFDPISSRIAEDLGFKLGMLAGSVAAMTVLGAPDLVLLTLSELADQVRRICRAGNIPLLVDADHGYGNALNVRRTVEELEIAGVAALTIEDTLLPAPFGGNDKSLISIEEGARKIEAAVSARRDPDLIVVARTAAASIFNISEAVKRAQTYAEAGADALFFSGIKTREQITALHTNLSLPIILGAVPAELSDARGLAMQGVRVCLQGHKPFLAAVRASHDALKKLAEGTPPAEIASVASPDLIKQVTRRDNYTLWIKQYLNP